MTVFFECRIFRNRNSQARFSFFFNKCNNKYAQKFLNKRVFPVFGLSWLCLKTMNSFCKSTKSQKTV